MLIRPAQVRDLPGIFAIYDEHVLHGTATAQTVPYTLAQRDEWFARHQPATHPLLVACTGDLVAGWSGLSPWSPREAYARSAESSVYIHPAHQGAGLGRKLMLELIARARRDTPVRIFIARIGDDNAPSIRLHASLGFETVGVIRRNMEKFGRLLDVRIMTLDLDA